MRSWTDTTYRLDTDEHLMLTRHDAYISLSLPGYMTDGCGINLYLKPEHLPELRDAVAALDAIARGQDGGEPFPNADALSRAQFAAEACPGAPSRDADAERDAACPGAPSRDAAAAHSVHACPGHRSRDVVHDVCSPPTGRPRGAPEETTMSSNARFRIQIWRRNRWCLHCRTRTLCLAQEIAQRLTADGQTARIVRTVHLR